MALATVCPHCNTTFRVASDQLKLRGGIVRCGACNEVFDGNAALIDLAAIAAQQADAAAAAALPPPAPPSAIDTPDAQADVVPADDVPIEDVPAVDAAPIDEGPDEEAPVEAAPEPSASAAFDAEVAAIEAQETGEVAEEEPIYTLDFDTTFDPFGILPKSMHPAPEPHAEPLPLGSDPVGSDPGLEWPAASGADTEPQADEEILALPVLDDEFDEHDEPPQPAAAPAATEPLDLHPPLLMRASAAAEPASAALPEPQAPMSKSARRNAARRKKAEPTLLVPAAAPEPEPEADEPEFVKRIRLQEQTGRTRRIVMGAASALLVLALAAQGVTTFRNVLAARYPQAKPLLAGACAVFGCKVELPAQIDALSVETGELQTLGANTFSFTTLLRNQGDLVQAWPHIELALTDANDKPLVRRVFTPAEYLPQGVAPAKGFGARSEQPVKLFFELNAVKASGYHIAIFYP